MIAVALAELRAAIPTWIALAATFIVVNFALALALLVYGAGSDAVALGELPLEDSAAITLLPLFNLFLAAIAAVMVVGSATQLVIEARRSAIARLALAGASPAQVVATVLFQIAAVTVAAAIVGDLLALAVLRPAVVELLSERGADAALIAVSVHVELMLLGNAIAILVAVLGGWVKSRAAANIAPVEALRQAAAPRPKRQLVRMIGAVLIAFLVIGTTIAVPNIAPQFGKEGGSLVLQSSMFVLLLTAWALSLAAPVSVQLLTRGWTSLVRSRSAVWHIARAGALARRERLANSVVPVSLAIGLMFGLMLVAQSVNLALKQARGFELEYVGPSAILSLIGLALLISIAGGIGSVIMMARQRSAELALAGIAGATEEQRVLIPIVEAAIVTVSSTILGLIMSAAALTVAITGLGSIGYPTPISVPWVALLSIAGIGLLITAAATTLPTLGALRQPAPRVIARLIAD